MRGARTRKPGPSGNDPRFLRNHLTTCRIADVFNCRSMRVAHMALLPLLALLVAACAHREPVISDSGPANVAPPAGLQPPAATPAVPAPSIPAEPVPPVVKAPAPAPALDLNALETQLKETKAIGLFTKITLKNQVDDLLGQFRRYYQGKAKLTLKDLRRSYDLLMMKVLTLLQDDDQRLASAIVSSREAIWRLLANEKTFATLQG
jgi:hypothetical protein